MTRAEILERARTCVCGEQDYGTPEDNFLRIAGLWTAYVGGQIVFEPVDVAMMMALLKIARVKTGTGTADSFVDLAGYAALAGEVSGGNRDA